MPRIRVLASIASISAGCRAAPPPRTAAEPLPPELCSGLDDDACQERALMRSLCLQQPDDAGCGALRALRLLPAPPPPRASLDGCWQVDRPRDDLPAAWICLGADDVAISGLGVWDVWPHTGWHREDTPRVAGWTTTLADGRSLWLTVVRTAPALALHLTDGSGQFATALGRGDPGLAAEVIDRRAALPPVATVCAAARACLDALPRPAPPPEAADRGIESTPEDDLLAAAQTLRACHDAWRAAAARLEFAVGRDALPRACAIAPASDRDAWAVELQPPFATF